MQSVRYILPVFEQHCAIAACKFKNMRRPSVAHGMISFLFTTRWEIFNVCWKVDG